VAGYVEHAFGAWHVRHLPVDAVVSDVDALALYGHLLPPAAAPRTRKRVEGAERSLSGFALMLGVRGPTAALAHHNVLFPADYDAEFDDVFRHRRPVRDPTIYVAASSVTDRSEAPDGGENWFVLVNAPTHGGGLDWDAEADSYESELLERLAARGLDPQGRIEVRARRTPADLERETGAPGGAIYGAAPHGRLGSLGRPANRSPAARGLHLVGGTTHPGGGLPLVILGAKVVAREIGPA
jgi:phytoene dehydrogenase-like protein